ncbi:MAG: flagellar biosynthesis protein FlhB [Synergistaceae bacterium]|jgi:flagellar biosynthetic protein FlhB|nr:flagellar biosynthesis protein FlhB [Synergistaceae bacterium]
MRATDFDLQFFAEERTEPATPRKRQKVRSEGKVCKSTDLTAAVEILAGLIGLLMLGPYVAGGLVVYLQRTILFLGDKSFFQEGWLYQPEFSAVRTYFSSWLPLGLIIAVIVIAITIYQVGWGITMEPFVPNLGKMNPISGMKKIISMRSLVELLKGLLKASLFGIVLYVAMRDKLPLALSAMHFPMERGAVVLWDMLWDLSMRMALMLLVIGILDYFYQKWDFEKSIKMSKQEIKEEFKQTEGDPQIKSKIRQKQREMAKNRMMSSVPKADVIVTNPTFIAVALVYKREVQQAPQVVAKGEGFIARKIREVGMANGVPIVEDRQLARAIYGSVEVGEEIPVELYEGVAKLLSMVYKLNEKKGKAPK